MEKIPTLWKKLFASFRTTPSRPASEQQSKYDLTKWNPVSSPEWSSTAQWDSYYQRLTALPDDDGRKTSALFKEYFLLNAYLPKFSGWEIQSILDVGCGISLMPYVLKYLGYQVTAIDLSKNAIQFLEEFAPTEEQLARCLRFQKPYRGLKNKLGQEINASIVIDDVEQTLPMLRKKYASGGSVRFIADNWNNRSLNNTYDLIHSLNNFNRATYPFTLKSIRSFKRMLNPGGVLIIHNENVFGWNNGTVGNRITELIEAEGFSIIRGSNIPRDKSKKYARASWKLGYFS